MRNYFFLSLLCVLFLTTCGEDDQPNPSTDDQLPPVPEVLDGPYTIEGASILKDGVPTYYKGVNTLQTFGLGDAELMNEWNVQIVREFIGNLREQPITEDAIQASDGVWYHGLQKIADRNRANDKITIFCPFGWVNEAGQQQLFTGLNPSEQPFYEAYKQKMKAIAEQFKDQPDVWIEVWNEPYSWNNSNGYTHDRWLVDMQDMVDNLRWVDGFQNIILVPGNEQDQSENALFEKGKELLEGRYNILFDLHAYEKWLVNTTEEELTDRLQAIADDDFAFIMGEVGVQNVGEVMPVQHFLDAAKATNTTTLAWLWNLNSDDKNALLTDDGQANATSDNNLWGSRFRDFLQD